MRMLNKIGSSRLVDMKLKGIVRSSGAAFFTRLKRPLGNRPISDDLSAFEEQVAEKCGIQMRNRQFHP